jgi:hypothetical protein
MLWARGACVGGGVVGCLEMTRSLYFLGPMPPCFLPSGMLGLWRKRVARGSVPPAAAGWAVRTNGFPDGCRGRGLYRIPRAVT